jgi:sulfur-oxidizing protein SoxB
MKSLITHALAAASLMAASAAETPESRTVSLVFVNDIHAQLEPHAELFWSGKSEEYVHNVGGLARMATVFKQLREQAPGSQIFIDGGDTIQGSGPAAWSEGKVVVAPMNALGLDVAIPGNWAVAYGKSAWKQRAQEFNYPVIAANMSDEFFNEQLFAPYLIKEVNGLHIGIIGFTEPQIKTRQPPFMSDGLEFQAEEVLQPLIDELRQEKKVDLVVLVTHIGLPKATALAERLEGEDIILSADTHERTYEPIVRDGTWIVEAGAFASFVGKMDLTFDAAGKLIDRSWRLIELRPEHFPEDPEMKRVVSDSLASHRSRMDQVIGRSDVWLARYAVLNTSMDQVIADSIRKATGADVALSNGFRFSPPTPPGAITEADLWNWLPIDLTLKTGRATGEQLVTYWETELENVFSSNPARLFGGWLPRSSGMSLDFHKNAEEGERVLSAHVGNDTIDPDQLYRLAAGDRKGSPAGNIHRVPNCQFNHTLPMTTHQAVKRYLAEESPVRGNAFSSVRCGDCEGTMRSQFIAP